MNLSTIESITDPRLPDVLDIYQRSFPPTEQMLASWFLRWLTEGKPDRRLIVAEDGGEVAGFAVWDFGDEETPAYLWYIAVDTNRRSAGVGTLLYDHVMAACFAQNNPAVMFEIESVDLHHHPNEEAAKVALARKQWYFHRGAWFLAGVKFLCGTDWYPAIEMEPMVHFHPDKEIPSAKQAFEWGLEVLGDGNDDAFSQVARLALQNR